MSFAVIITTTNNKPDGGELLDAARSRVAELCARHNIAAVPTVALDLRGCSAGRAVLRENHIRLNHVLFAENFDDFMAETIPHELCHLWHYQKQRHKRGGAGRAHGREWRLLMLVMGARGSRTHCYDVANARVRPERSRARFEYACGCPAPHQVGAVVHNRITRGRAYRCRKCRRTLSPIAGLTSESATDSSDPG